MKVILDTCVSPKAKNELDAAGHDVVWVGDWTEDPGDQTILARAHEQGRILVTLDKDFGELGVLCQAQHSRIIRLVSFRAGQQGPLCFQILAGYADELARGAVITAEPGRIKIRHRGDETSEPRRAQRRSRNAIAHRAGALEAVLRFDSSRLA